MKTRFPFSDLPEELLVLISKCLDTPADIQSFRAVCQSWRSSCPLPPHLLSLVLPHTLKSPQPEVSSKQLTIIASNTYIIEPLVLSTSSSVGVRSKPWLIRVEEFEPGKLRVREPLTHHKPMRLPEFFPRIFILSRFKVVQVFTGYNFCSNGWWGTDKLLLYTSPINNSKSGGGAKFGEALVLCRMGKLYKVYLEYEKWCSIQAGRISKFDDMIRFQERNYLVDRKGRLYNLIDIGSVPCIVRDPICGGGGGSAKGSRKRLVAWSEELYLVRRDEYVIRVYKLNQDEHRWDEIDDLGGKLLFVATDCCFFVDVENFSGWKENTVVFHKESFPTYRGEFYPDSSLFGGGMPPIGVYLWRADRCCRISTQLGDMNTLWPPGHFLDD